MGTPVTLKHERCVYGRREKGQAARLGRMGTGLKIIHQNWGWDSGSGLPRRRVEVSMARIPEKNSPEMIWRLFPRI